MRFIELFAGAGGLSLGLERAGLTCVAHAEVDPFARRVLAARWPDVPLLGDVRGIRGADLPACDLVSGGSPCQDLSVAGKRAGLIGSRSRLFFEQIRVWRESGAPWLLWENVVGALSSNRGKDFGRILSTIVGAPVCVPRDRKRARRAWPRAGRVRGPDGVAEWRILDAQWFGVPQRRRRVFVCGARTSEAGSGAVLLEPEGVRWNPAAGGAAREGAAGGAGGGVAFQSSQSGVRAVDTFATLDANYGGRRHNGVLAFDERNVTSQTNRSNPRPGDPCCTLHKPHDLIAVVAGPLGHGGGRGYRNDLDSSGAFPVEAWTDALAGTLSARDFKGPGSFRDGQLQASAVVAGVPRRLTPRECERLQDWPDDWTQVSDERGRPASDAARYRVIGNGVASCVATWIGLRLAALSSVG